MGVKHNEAIDNPWLGGMCKVTTIVRYDCIKITPRVLSFAGQDLPVERVTEIGHFVTMLRR